MKPNKQAEFWKKILSATDLSINTKGTGIVDGGFFQRLENEIFFFKYH